MSSLSSSASEWLSSSLPSVWSDVVSFPFLLAGVGIVLLWRLLRALCTSNRRAPTRPQRKPDRSVSRGSGRSIDCVNPATGERLGQVASFTPQEVSAAYQRAKVAAADWRLSSFTERRALLMDILDWIVDHQTQVIEWSVSESGKTVTEATLGEVMMSCEKIRWIVAEGEASLRSETRRVPSLLFTKAARVEYYPMGVIGVIVPWNYPFHNVLSAVVAALFAGNGVLCKVSEVTSFSAAGIEDMFRSILARRGYDPELVQIITGFADTGAALIKSGVDKVLFIGSPATGKRVMETASSNLTPVILELGGKDPFIVFDDCDLKQTVEIAIRGAFINLGQNCISAERFYVQAGVYDQFIKAVEERMAELRCGPSSFSNRCDFGSMTMSQQVEIVSGLIEDAVSKGARLICGGHRTKFTGSKTTPSNGSCGKGCLFFEPTVLADVNHSMKIANEEAFGPCMTIIKFKHETDVVEMANRSRYGLGSSIFSRDYTRAERVGSMLDTGQVSINDFGMVPLIQSLPFGGCKDSGFGHFNGPEGLRGFSRVRAVVTDRFRFPMAAPKFLQYPVNVSASAIVQEGIRMVYGRSWSVSAVALFRMMKLIFIGEKQTENQKRK